MTPVDQSKFGEVKGDCFAACIASVLGLSLAEVPNFCAGPNPNWWQEFRAWAEMHGFFVGWTAANLEAGDPPAGPSIASGPSPRGDFLHAVVWTGGAKGRIQHDPHPSRAGLAGPVVDWIWLVAA